MMNPLKPIAGGVVTLLFVACANFQPLQAVEPPISSATLGELRPGIVPGYLPRATLVDSLALLPEPPAPGSAAFAADDAAYQRANKDRSSARWHLATADAELKFPLAAKAFSCALGVPITQEQAPHITMLLRRTLTDAGLATYKAKDFYKRTRPFVQSDTASCTPKDEASLRKDGSYPSGHASLGWAWGLVLTEIAPERQLQLVRRGFEFGQSRVVCGVHWQSDVDAGRLVGAAVVAQLQSNPVFKSQVAYARQEFQKLRALHPEGPQACEVENQTLRRIAPTPG